MPIIRKAKTQDPPSEDDKTSPQPEENAPTPAQPFVFTNFLPENDDVKAIAEEQCKSNRILHYDPVGINIETALDAGLVHNIRRQYRGLLPLQEYCTEILLHADKHNLLVSSPTGSGKTAAFCIPAVQTAIQHKSKTGPSVIIICNTQNLAKQTCDQLRCFTGKVPIENVSKTPFPKDTGVNIFGMYKGGDHFRVLGTYQPDIVIATLGLLLRNIQEKKLDLSNLKMFIADEADKMIVEGGFFAETQECLRLCRENVPCFQVAAFSATYTYFTNRYGFLDLDTKSMRVLYPEIRPVQVTIEGAKGFITQRIVRIVREGLSKEATPIDSLKNTYFVQKLGWLIGMLNYDKEQNFRNGKYKKTAVVFVERITTSNFLTTYLISKGYDVAPLNSSFALVEVNKTLEKLKNGEIQAVIATNKMARGQDVADLNHVIVFEMSNDFNDYKHRIGRTGRIGKGGMSTTLISDQDKQHYSSLYEFLEEHNQNIPNWLHDIYTQVKR